MATVAVIVIALGVVSPDRWFGGPKDTDSVQGTFVLANDPAVAEPTAHAAFARSEYGVRLLPEDRAEVRVDGGFVNGFYHIEKDSVLVETVDAPKGNQAWTFKIDGKDRLIQGNLVLHRASR